VNTKFLNFIQGFGTKEARERRVWGSNFTQEMNYKCKSVNENGANTSHAQESIGKGVYNIRIIWGHGTRK
jgi:hypothetical protein